MYHCVPFHPYTITLSETAEWYIKHLKLRKIDRIYLSARLGGGVDVPLHRSFRPQRGAHAVVHLLIITLKINIKIRRDNGAYGTM